MQLLGINQGETDMRLQTDCIPCILQMTIKSLRKLGLSEADTKVLLNDIMAIPGLTGNDWSRTSPDIIEVIMKKAYLALGDDDPFRNIKQQLNERVTDMLPFTGNLVKESADPLRTAAKLAILGNAIDFMMPGGTEALEDYIREKLKMELDHSAYESFKTRLSHSKQLLYFTDNCGEIVLDKLFLQILHQHFDIDVTIVTRHLPTLNDATLKEAADIGLEDVARVIDNGIDGPLPGTRIDRCSSEVQEQIKTCDLIISKGGGNFDSLEEQLPILKTDITFMLLSKCYPICNYFDTRLHQPIIANFHRPI